MQKPEGDKLNGENCKTEQSKYGVSDMRLKGKYFEDRTYYNI